MTTYEFHGNIRCTLGCSTDDPGIVIVWEPSSGGYIATVPYWCVDIATFMPRTLEGQARADGKLAQAQQQVLETVAKAFWLPHASYHSHRAASERAQGRFTIHPGGPTDKKCAQGWMVAP